MLSKLILLMLLVNMLMALPTSELDVQSSEQAWSVENACNEIKGTSLVKNQDDPTCSSYVFCYANSEQVRGLIKTCKSGTFFDDSLKMCVNTKPDVCA